MAIQKVTKKQALLIEEGADITERMKKDKERLDEIKDLLTVFGIDKKGNYASDAAFLNITEKEAKGTTDPVKLLAMLKEKRMGKHFPECVSVVKKDTLRFISEKEFTSITTSNGKILSWSFKK